MEVQISGHVAGFDLFEMACRVQIPLMRTPGTLTVTALTHIEPLHLRAFSRSLATLAYVALPTGLDTEGVIANLANHCAALQAEVDRLGHLPEFLAALASEYLEHTASAI
jgi:hypothetical protein